METSALSAALPSPLGIPARGFSRFLLLNERSLNSGSKSLFKFYHLEKSFVMSYCAISAIFPYSDRIPSEGEQLVDFKGLQHSPGPAKWHIACW